MMLCDRWTTSMSTLVSSSTCVRSGKSAPVMIALTPGIAAASPVLIETMFAWAWGERSTNPWSIPGSAMSAENRALPVTLSRPSCRIGLVPTHLYAGSDGSVSELAALGLGAFSVVVTTQS